MLVLINLCELFYSSTFFRIAWDWGNVINKQEHGHFGSICNIVWEHAMLQLSGKYGTQSLWSKCLNSPINTSSTSLVSMKMTVNLTHMQYHPKNMQWSNYPESFVNQHPIPSVVGLTTHLALIASLMNKKLKFNFDHMQCCLKASHVTAILQVLWISIQSLLTCHANEVIWTQLCHEGHEDSDTG